MYFRMFCCAEMKCKRIVVEQTSCSSCSSGEVIRSSGEEPG